MAYLELCMYAVVKIIKPCGEEAVHVRMCVPAPSRSSPMIVSRARDSDEVDIWLLSLFVR